MSRFMTYGHIAAIKPFSHLPPPTSLCRCLDQRWPSDVAR